MEGTLRQQAEYYLGAKIGSSEWVEAKEYAERKLKGIIEREGDENGARREPWYLAQLIAETVKSNRFSQFTFDLADLIAHADEYMGVKKDSPCYKNTSRPAQCTPIVSQNFAKCNRRI